MGAIHTVIDRFRKQVLSGAAGFAYDELRAMWFTDFLRVPKFIRGGGWRADKWVGRPDGR
jgi:hypothetical protein